MLRLPEAAPVRLEVIRTTGQPDGTEIASLRAADDGLGNLPCALVVDLPYARRGAAISRRRPGRASLPGR